jgi:hypothetical protein
VVFTQEEMRIGEAIFQSIQANASAGYDILVLGTRIDAVLSIIVLIVAMISGFAFWRMGKKHVRLNSGNYCSSDRTLIPICGGALGAVITGIFLNWIAHYALLAIIPEYSVVSDFINIVSRCN